MPKRGKVSQRRLNGKPPVHDDDKRDLSDQALGDRLSRLKAAELAELQGHGRCGVLAQIREQMHATVDVVLPLAQDRDLSVHLMRVRMALVLALSLPALLVPPWRR